MSREVSYVIGAELPDLAVTWRDSSGDLIDFSVAHTFQLIVDDLTKTTGITGASTDPNVLIAWATGDLDTPNVRAGRHRAQLRARRTSDSKDRYLQFHLTIKAAVPVGGS